MFNNFIEKDGNYKLLEQFTNNGRTLIVWYNISDQVISGAIFTNDINKTIIKKQFRWGFVTKFIQKIETTEEAAQVAGLYIKDIQNENFWWEKT